MDLRVNHSSAGRVQHMQSEWRVIEDVKAGAKQHVPAARARPAA